MPPTFDRKNGVWRDKGRFASPPPEAAGLKWDGERWRTESGAFARDPDPPSRSRPFFGRSTSSASQRKRSGERAPTRQQIVDRTARKAGISKASVRRQLKGIPTAKLNEGGVFVSSDGVVRPAPQAIARNLNIQRNSMIRGISKLTGRSFTEIRNALKGIPTRELAGRFRGIDPRTGKGRYIEDPPDELRDRANKLKRGDPEAKALRERARLIEHKNRVLKNLGYTGPPLGELPYL